MLFAPNKLKRGDELTLYWLNRLRALAIRSTVNLGVNSGLCMVQNDAGTFLRVEAIPQVGRLAITDGAITARSSTTAGSGNVFVVTASGTTLTTDSSHDVAVLNFSSTSGGIATGVYVWIQQDPSGTWFITAVDCGN